MCMCQCVCLCVCVCMCVWVSVSCFVYAFLCVLSQLVVFFLCVHVCVILCVLNTHNDHTQARRSPGMDKWSETTAW